MRITMPDLGRLAGAAVLAMGLAYGCGSAVGSANPNLCDPPEMCVPGCSGCPQQTGGDIGGTACPVLGEHKDGYVCHSTIAGKFWGY